MKLTDTDITAIKIYFPKDGTIKIHQNRVSPCPLGFPAGCYWYGETHKCPSLPKWAASLFCEQPQSDSTDQTQSDSTKQIQNDTTGQICKSSEPQSSANIKSPKDNNQLSRATKASTSSDVPLPATRKTCTRNIVLPVRYRDQPRCADNEGEG